MKKKKKKLNATDTTWLLYVAVEWTPVVETWLDPSNMKSDVARKSREDAAKDAQQSPVIIVYGMFLLIIFLTLPSC